MSLTDEEKIANHETWEHIYEVQALLLKVVIELQQRLISHDISKLNSPEVEKFTQLNPKLAECSSGSEEYKKLLLEMKKESAVK